MTPSALIRRLLARLALILVMGLASGGIASRAGAQVQPGAICVSAFADLNSSGACEEGEPPLAGVIVELWIGGAVIASHAMAEGEAQYCFESLARGAYTVTFVDSPAYRATTASQGTFNLDPGQRLTLTDFGAVPVAGTDQAAPPTQAAEPLAQTGAVVLETTPDDEPLDSTRRLLLSTIGALGVMIFMIGLGAILLAVFGLDPRRVRRRPSRSPRDIPPPTHIAPPRR